MNQHLIFAAINLLKRERPTLVAATGLLFGGLLSTEDNLALEKILESYRNGVWGEEAIAGQGFPILRSTNTKGVRVDIVDPAWRHVIPTKAQECSLRTGDILVTKSSGSTDLVGKAALFVHPEDGNTYLFSNFMMRLRPNQSIVIPEYLAWFLRSPQALAWRYESQQTTVGLRNLQTKEFLSQIIPLPSIPIQKSVVDYLNRLEIGNVKLETVSLPMSLYEQRRIVAKIDELAAKIEEACTLRQQAAQETEGLLTSTISAKIFSASETAAHQLLPLESVCELVTDGAHNTPRYVEEGVPLLTAKNVFWDRIDTDNVQHISREEHEPIYRRCPVRCGDVLFINIGATTGTARKVDIDMEFSVKNVAMLRADAGQLDTDFLVYLLRGSTVRDQIVDRQAQTCQQFLALRDIRNLKVPVPPLPKQRRIVIELDALQAELGRLKRLQAETGAELDALLPSILDKAFKGEL